MMRCLQENLWQPDFGQACMQQVAQREEAMQADFREDASLAAACAAEVDTLCQAEQVRPPLARPPLSGVFGAQPSPRNVLGNVVPRNCRMLKAPRVGYPDAGSASPSLAHPT